MGNTAAVALSTHQIITRLEEAVLPEEKESALDYFEMIEAKLQSSLTRKITSDQFKELNGLPVVVKITKKLIKDEMSVRLGLSLIELQLFNVPLMLDFIQCAGVDLLRQVLKQHENDEALALTVPRLLKSVLSIGAGAAIQEIRKEALSLQLCQVCQETVERERRRTGGSFETKMPQSSDRINRVLMFMESYPNREDVLAESLNAVLLFARNADCEKQIDKTNVIVNVFDAVEANPEMVCVVWRAALIFAIISKIRPEIANTVSKTGVHEIMATNFWVFKEEPFVQQQILWMMASIVSWPKSRRRVQESEKCIALFIELAGMREELLKKAVNNATKHLPYVLCVPLPIRTFLRESGGLVVPGEVPYVEKKVFAERRNFGEKPMFGTVAQSFQKGKTGLVDDGKQEERPWEDKLQYGAERTKKKQPSLQARAASSKVLPKQ